MARRKYIEDDLQIQIVYYVRNYVKNVVIFHIPNGGKRGKIEGARFKRMGVLAGVADLCLMLPGGRTLWIELKTSDGSQSDPQIDFEENCKKLNHDYVVIKSIDEFIALLKTLK